MQNIILCGLQGCGKSTIGKLLASKLSWNFIDTDQLIEKTYTQETGNNFSCRKICLENGVSAFRDLEKKQILTLSNTCMHVISLGGGSLDQFENRRLLQSIGTIIYLKSPVEVLWKRIQKNGIPSYLNNNCPKIDFYTICQRRIPIFANCAQLTIETVSLSKQQIVDIILNLYMTVTHSMGRCQC